TALPGPQFQVRRRRLEQLLEQAQQVGAERALWEEHLTSHPVFQRALHQAIERMRDDLMGEARRRILAEAVEHREHISQLEKEEAAHRKALDQLRGVTQQAATALELMRQTRETLAPGPPPIDGHPGEQGPPTEGDWQAVAPEELAGG